MNSEKNKQLNLILCAGALALLILALLFSSAKILSTVFSLLCFLVVLFTMREELYTALRGRDLRSGVLLLVAAGILCICAGRFWMAAAALLIWRVGSFLLASLKDRLLAVLNTRRELSPLSSELPEAESRPRLPQKAELLLQSYFTYGMVFLAAVIAILTAVIGKAGISAALCRAAVVLALGGTYSIFAAFPLTDLAAIIRAGETGVLFRGDSLPRLLGFHLAAADSVSPTIIRSAAVYPYRAEAVGPELMLRLAIAACEDTGLPMEERLTAIVQTSFDEGEVEREILPGYGVAARVRELTIIAGSAELMKKAGLDVLPFSEKEQLLHLGVNGRYAGCIEFLEEAPEENAAAHALDAEGFFLFKDDAEADAKRLSGEEVLFLSPVSSPASRLKENDILALCGIPRTDAQVQAERSGQGGILAILENLQNARLGRKGSALVVLIIKALLVLLALFGICPLWLAVLLELAAVAFTFSYSLHLLDFSGKH